MAHDERQLLKSRRRKTWIGAALVLAVGSFLAFRAPQIKERGWVAAVPTKVIILSLPWLRPDLSRIPTYANQNPVTTWREQLFFDLVKRRLGYEPVEEIDAIDRYLIRAVARYQQPDAFDDVDAWDGLDDLVFGTEQWANDAKLQWSDDVEQPVKIDPLLISRTVWPVGTPVYVDVRQIVDSSAAGMFWRFIAVPQSGCPQASQWSRRQTNAFRCGGMGIREPEPWEERLIQIGVARAHAEALRFDASLQVHQGVDFYSRWKTLAADELVIPCMSVARVEDAITPIRSPELDDRLRDRLKPVIARHTFLWGECTTTFLIRLHLDEGEVCRAIEDLEGAAFGFDLEVLDHGMVLANASAWYAVGQKGGSYLNGSACIGLEGYDLQILDHACKVGALTLRIKGNPYMALRNLPTREYWAGEIELPLNVISDRELAVAEQ